MKRKKDIGKKEDRKTGQTHRTDTQRWRVSKGSPDFPHQGSFLSGGGFRVSAKGK